MKLIDRMITIRQLLHCAFATVLVLTLLPTLAAPAEKISLQLDSQKNPVIEFIVAPDVLELAFSVNNPRFHEIVRSKAWKAEDNCAVIEVARMVRTSATCRFRFTLTWDSAPVDRLYPPLISFANGGVMIFTEYPLVKIDGKGLPLEVLASPELAIAFRGQKAHGRLTIPADAFNDDLQGWIYIGPDKFANEAAANMLIDDGMPPIVSGVITQLSAEVLKLFANKFDVAPAEKPSFYLEWNRRDGPGRSVQADVVPGGVIRFGISGVGWKNANERDVATFRNIAAHEIAHFWNSGIYKPTKPQAPWLHEGNAELLSTAALYQLKVIDADAAAGKINTSINECLSAIGDASWRKFESRDRGASPYVCGLALHIAIAAAYQQQHAGEDVFALWRAVWRESPRYDETTLQAFMNGAGLAPQAARLNSILVSDESFRVVLLRMFFGAGLLTVLETTTPEALKNSLGSKLFATLMRLDCDDAVGFYAYPEHLQVEKIMGCKSFASGMKVNKIQGVYFLQDPDAAITAVRAACTANQAVNIETRDGPNVSLACSPAELGKIAPAFQAVRVDTKGLRNLLGGKS